MVFVSYCPKSSQKSLSEPKIGISIQFWIPVRNLSLIGWEIKVTERPHPQWSRLKLEMTSYSYNVYDVTSFCCFQKFLAYTLFLPSFIVVRHQMAELNWGASPIHYWVFRTPSKIGLRLLISVATWARYTILKLNIQLLTSQIVLSFEESIYQIFAKHSNDLHNICSLLSKQTSTNFKVNWSFMILFIEKV